ncbi:MAG: hypothetical protein NTU88_09875 [Armatimonadetes bacterium]|nr:hypothetical protein [Armatimonadota bacterium]
MFGEQNSKHRPSLETERVEDRDLGPPLEHIAQDDNPDTARAQYEAKATEDKEHRKIRRLDGVEFT